MERIKNILAFFSAQDVLSNWYPCRFTMNGVNYLSAEQAMMASKAELFGDMGTHQQILESNHPREAKALGRKVKGFNQGVWDRNKERLVHSVLLAKFSQNPELANMLRGTGQAYLLEGSKWDSEWGAGVSIDQLRRMNHPSWPGKNLLGVVLMRVRSGLFSLPGLTCPCGEQISLLPVSPTDTIKTSWYADCPFCGRGFDVSGMIKAS